MRSRYALLATGLAFAFIAMASCGHERLDAAPEAASSQIQSAPRKPTRETPIDLPRVVNPWHWSRATGASNDEKAIENIGSNPVDAKS
jgi:hypothetical protein